MGTHRKHSGRGNEPTNLPQLCLHGASAKLDPSTTSWVAALHLAAESRNEGIIKLVREKFTDANQTDYAGRSALLIAVQKKDEAVAKQLLSVYIDVNLKDIWDHTALHVAVEMNSRQLFLLRMALESTYRNLHLIHLILRFIDVSFAREKDMHAKYIYVKTTQLVAADMPVNTVIYIYIYIYQS